MRLKILLLVGSLWVPSVAAQTLTITGTGSSTGIPITSSSNVVTATTAQSGQYNTSNGVWVCGNNGACVTTSPPESEADKNKRLISQYKSQSDYYEAQFNYYRERENMNDAAMKIIQTYVESNGYAWSGINFLFHCIGIAALGLAGTVVYWHVTKAKKLK